MTTEQASIGVDVGGTSARAVAFDADLAPLTGVTRPTPQGAAAILDVIVELLDAIGPSAATMPIGIGIPGRVDPASGTVSAAINLGIDEPFALGKAVTQRLRRATAAHVENDVNAGALGAAHALGISAGNLGYLSVGTGIAAGFVIDGALHRGARGTAGEIGHIPILPDGPLCRCGQRGCLEAVASGRAIAAAWPAEPSRRGGPTPALELWDAADAGDADAVALRDRVAAALAWGVQLMVMTVDVDIVAMGGGVSQLGNRLLDAVRDQLERGAARSPALRSMDLAGRLTLVPAEVSLGALGAALAATAAARD